MIQFQWLYHGGMTVDLCRLVVVWSHLYSYVITDAV